MAQELTREEFDKQVSDMREENERLKILHEIRTERAKYCNIEEKRKIKTSNIVLICSIAAVILYTVTSILIQYHTGIEISSTLSTLWYGFWTVEITALAGIKVTKVIKENGSESEDSDSEAAG